MEDIGLNFHHHYHSHNQNNINIMNNININSNSTKGLDKNLPSIVKKITMTPNILSTSKSLHSPGDNARSTTFEEINYSNKESPLTGKRYSQVSVIFVSFLT